MSKYSPKTNAKHNGSSILHQKLAKYRALAENTLRESSIIKAKNEDLITQLLELRTQNQTLKTQNQTLRDENLSLLCRLEALILDLST